MKCESLALRFLEPSIVSKPIHPPPFSEPDAEGNGSAREFYGNIGKLHNLSTRAYADVSEIAQGHSKCARIFTRKDTFCKRKAQKAILGIPQYLLSLHSQVSTVFYCFACMYTRFEPMIGNLSTLHFGFRLREEPI